jgi:phage terminase large subunit
MDWQKSDIYSRNLKAVSDGGYNVIVNKGGTRSGKTWSLLQLLYTIAETLDGTIVSVVGESIPFLKRGALRDFRTMLGNVWCPDCWNSTDKVYTLPNGSQIEFFSCDNEGKVHGSARDVLFVNECYFIDWEIYRQLSVRTRAKVFLDYNPRSRFWVDEWLIGRDDVALIHSTYKDNPFLTSRQVEEIESYKDSDSNWWRVYGEGETGSVEGLVYTKWKIIDKLPATCKREFYCIDFGFTNDPTAILHVRLSGGELWIRELCYQRGMLNSDIVKVLKSNNVGRSASIVCDSAEQKSIAEINNLGGYHAIACTKGKGSIEAGISMVQAYKLNVTQDSLGTIDELRNYSWRRGIDGNYLNVPVDKYNHSLDALRYGVTTFLTNRRELSVPRMRIGHIC